MFIKEFEELNKRLEAAGVRSYQNPRNTAAGSLRQLDPSLTASRPLTLLTYAIVASSDPMPPTQRGLLDFLKASGFPVSSEVNTCHNIDEVIQVCEEWRERRDRLPYEADGVVIKINDLRLQADLGVVGKDPRGRDCPEIPGARGDHPAQGYRGQRGPDGGADALRDPGTGGDRRGDRQTGHPAQF